MAHVLRWAIVAMWGALGCYSPTVRDCIVSCAAQGECTGGQVCSNGWCAAPEVSCLDAEPMVDAPAMSDVPPETGLCSLGCSKGTCDPNGVCVIDCSAPDSCPNDITCPLNLPCRVVCGGDRSCHGKVICGLATTCEVVCAGTDACADEIQCGINRPCDITCTGERSCKKRFKCKDACRCDARCIGPSSCGETPECPLGATCRIGNGCTDTLPGCDRCES